MPVDNITRLIRCMDGVSRDFVAEGATAVVNWLPAVAAEGVIGAAESLLRQRNFLLHTNVFVAGADGRYVAESYSPDGRRIRFCGHGALAAAWFVFEEAEPNATVLEFSGEQQSWRARRAQDSAGNTVLVYDRPTAADCSVPPFAAACLGLRAQAAAEAGGETDYLILELADPNQVRGLKPDLAAIEAHTRRALIATARDNGSDGPGCVYRYFAPQYGTPEDAATGSAAVQLAAYWAPRLQRDRFRALQLSPQGALVELVSAGDKVELAARVGYG